jgi:SAM-dependent methyltransferase
LHGCGKLGGDTRKVGCYDDLADEYYDAARHPTCRNFRDASARYIKSAISALEMHGLMVDVGAGNSVLAELCAKGGGSLANLLLIDRAPGMLAHSERYRPHAVRMTVGDATLMPLRPLSTSIIVASLGDAYNTEYFWREVKRCLRPSGVCIFTTPAFEWANSFRQSALHECKDLAYFELNDGRSVYVPSIIHPLDTQRAVIECNGLHVTNFGAVRPTEIQPPHSPKILSLSASEPIVVGYTITIPQA